MASIYDMDVLGTMASSAYLSVCGKLTNEEKKNNADVKELIRIGDWLSENADNYRLVDYYETRNKIKEIAAKYDGMPSLRFQQIRDRQTSEI